MNKKKTLEIITIIAVALIINLSIISLNYTLSNDLKNTNSVLEHYEEKLSKTQESYEKNQSILGNLTEGDEYLLHNPLRYELNDFLENENNTNASTVVNNAKKEGLRCAYVQVIIGEMLLLKELIGFNVSGEKNMSYYEIKTHHQIEPIIGINYSECFVTGELDDQVYNKRIRDIVTIW